MIRRLALLISILSLTPRASAAEPPTPGASGAPQVRISTLADGQHVAGIVRIAVDIVHPSPVTQVSISKGPETLTVDFDPPFELDWDTRKESDGPYLLRIEAIDADFRQGIAQITVTVDNTPPSVKLTEPKNGTIASASTWLAAEAEDIIGISAVRFLANGTVVGEVTASPYRFEWDSNTVPNTRYAIQARAVDHAGNSANSKEVRVKVANFNRQPNLEPIGPKVAIESQPFSFTIKGSDPDAPRDPVIYEAFNLPPWGTFDPKTGQFSGTPPSTEASLRANVKEYPAVKFQVCDPEPVCDSEEIIIAVMDTNGAPVVDPVSNFDIKENDTISFKLMSHDPDGDATTCKARRMPKWASFNTFTCIFRGTPDTKVASLEQTVVEYAEVMFEVCDKQPLCTKRYATIKVRDVNGSPSWNTLPPQEGGEDRRIQIDVKAADPDEDQLKIKAEVLPDGAVLVDNGDGTGRITWKPRADQSGQYEALLKVSDTNLAALLIIPITIIERVLAISGTMANENKEPYEGVLVRLLERGSVIQETTTNETGYFLFSNLKPGAYVIKPSYEFEESFKAGVSDVKEMTFEPMMQRIELGSIDHRGLDFMVEVK